MEERESYHSDVPFPVACEYVRTVFFAKLRSQVFGIRAIPPITNKNEADRLMMTDWLRGKEFVSVLVERDSSGGGTYVTAMSKLQFGKYVVSGCMLSLFTCGLGAIVAAPIMYMTYSGWQKHWQLARGILKSGLPISASVAASNSEHSANSTAPTLPDGATRSCGKCSATNPPNGRYCEQCGEKLT